jgi:hypothetical protein
MKKRIKITVIAACVLLMCLTVTTALAGYVYSTATINYGSTSYVKGGSQSLTSVSLSGKIVSEDTSTGDRSMYGNICTQGDIWIHIRDEDHVSPGMSCTLYWSNPDHNTGTFWAEAQAAHGNHDGYGQAKQWH